MSRCYYLKTENFVQLDAVLGLTQMLIKDEYTVKVKEFDGPEGEGGCYYIEGVAARGILVYHEDDSIVVEIQALCNYADYTIAEVLLDILGNIFRQEIIDDDGKVIVVDKYFTKEKIQELREADALAALSDLKELEEDNVQIQGIVRKVYFGERLTGELLKYEDNPKRLLSLFDCIIDGVQYKLPDYQLPEEFLIRREGSSDKRDMRKVRKMRKGTPYILQDYDYLFVIDDEQDKVFAIDFYDLNDMTPDIYEINQEFMLTDDFTIVFPKLEGEDWQKFIDLVKERPDHQVLMSMEVVPQDESNFYQSWAPNAQAKKPCMI